MEFTRREAVGLLGKALVAAPIVAAKSGEATSAPVGASKDTGSRLDPALHPVYVVLWFDTEDYISPASDDAAKRIAGFLTEQGIRATFKVVGEKARVLERRGRRDVIAAISRHEIGYHSNTHSQQPTIAQYESQLDWEDGAEEFDRRERVGFEDVGRIFGIWPTCYGQPGSSWAPQVFPALKRWGVHIYLDDSPHVRLEGKPFWYGGLFNIFRIQAGQQLEQNADWSNLDEAKANFRDIYEQMGSQAPGGLISFMFHPTQFVSKIFWDAANFAQGANPPHSAWVNQPLNDDAVRERAFHYLEGLVTYIKSFPAVRFVTASQAYVLYQDKAQGRNVEPSEIAEIATALHLKITYQVHKDHAFSASEIFALLNSFIVNDGTPTPVRLDGTPYGPSAAPYGTIALQEGMQIAWDQFSRTSIEVNSFLEKQRQVPDVVWLGSIAVTPESYLLALGSVAQKLVSQGHPPASVTLLPAQLAAAQWIAEDSAATWDWPIFPKGFHSAHIMELARLQAWTLKPAILIGETASNQSGS